MVRAIDVQQVIMQIQQAEKVQQVQQQHPDMQQRHFELQLREEKRRLREKVKDTEETGGTTIREKSEREKQQNTGDHQGRGEDALQREGEEELSKGDHVNIKV